MRTVRSIALLSVLSIVGIGCATRAPDYDAYAGMPPPPQAQAQAEAENENGKDAAPPEADGPKPAVREPHGFRILLGGVTDREDGGFVLGGQYEYRLQHNLGVGAFSDLTFGDDTEATLGAALFWHPAERVTILAGPGVELDGSGDVFARVGGSYDIPVDQITISPAAYVDLGAHDTPVLLGILLGWRF